MNRKAQGSTAFFVAAVVAIIIVAFFFARNGGGNGNPSTEPIIFPSKPAAIPTPTKSIDVKTSPTPSGQQSGAPAGTDEISDLVLLDDDGNEIPISSGNDLGSGICGDGACSPLENCKSCEEDCGCKTGESCAENGLCILKNVCGDGLCSVAERNGANCCYDCGCVVGDVCNEAKNTCEGALPLSDSQLSKIALTYINQSGGNYTYSGASDGYYDGKIVKELLLSCKNPPGYECSVLLIADKTGKIIAELPSQ
ncbi:MAG TPA: hypothetical protein VJI13_02360 [Candidatus Norongarragalinales archaeon]|nr:hypothetical protein [Candidatus Norongarragalinales archaeon]